MLRLTLIIFFTLVLSCCKSNPVVVIKTEFGDIKVELYKDRAPVTVTNFLRYVKNNAFENSSFYRTVTMKNQPENDIKIEVIQGGLYDENKMYDPVKHEPTKVTGILHKDGVISMARLEPGTATSEYFICVGDQVELDYGGKRNPDGQGFAAFGKVIEGMEVVKKIHVQPENGQMLTPRIKVFNIIEFKD
ncbi:MAG: peptidylprolyl isomerase [Ignavibacteria bacterium]|jgi:peptidyl-prolyl cis-trans isomerase A (cyclophilin A)